MKTVYCIGLNVGDAEPQYQLNDTLRQLANAGQVHALQIGAGAWGDCGERMLQVSIDLDYFNADYFAAQIARALSQECVSVLDVARGRWRLVTGAGEVSDGGTLADYPLLAGVAP